MQARKGTIFGFVLISGLGIASPAQASHPDGMIVGTGGTPVAASLAPEVTPCVTRIEILFTEVTADTTPVGVVGKVQASAFSDCFGTAAFGELITLHLYINGTDNESSCSTSCASGEFLVDHGDVVRAVAYHRLERVSPANWTFIPSGFCNVAPTDSTNDIVCHSSVDFIPLI